MSTQQLALNINSNLFHDTPFYDHPRTTIEFSVGGEFLHIVGQHVTIKGYTCIMPWLAVKENNLPQFTKGEKVKISKVDLYEVLSLFQSLCFGFFFAALTNIS